MAPTVNKQDHVCGMCGDEGHKHSLITCSSCGALQHMYCMTEVMIEVPTEWHCDNCQSKTQDLLNGKGVGKRLLEFPVGPSIYCSWKGRFKIKDEEFMGLEFRLSAHPPPLATNKTHRFSTTMPEEVELTMVPRSNLLTNMFPSSPTKEDIALYFFCSDEFGGARYFQILELLEMKDFVMSSCIKGMKLIVLSSRLLPSGSQDWLGRPFMWSFLRPLKNYKNICELNATVVVPKHDPVSVNGMNIDIHGSSSQVMKNTFPLPPPLPPTHPMNYGVPSRSENVQVKGRRSRRDRDRLL